MYSNFKDSLLSSVPSLHFVLLMVPGWRKLFINQNHKQSVPPWYRQDTLYCNQLSVNHEKRFREMAILTCIKKSIVKNI